jgi:hypothetical protein
VKVGRLLSERKVSEKLFTGERGRGDREKDRQTDRDRHRKIDRQTDRERDRQTDDR